MKAAQKKPIKIALSRSLCNQVYGGVGTGTGGGPRLEKADAKEASAKQPGK